MWRFVNATDGYPINPIVGKVAQIFLGKPLISKEYMEKLILRFNYPPPELLPNKKSCWQESMRITKRVRGDAYIMGYDQGGKKAKPLEKVSLVITWYPASKKVADYDSQLGATKPIIDGGLVDAGFLMGDSPRVVQEVIIRYGEVDEENPRTEIEVIPNDD